MVLEWKPDKVQIHFQLGSEPLHATPAQQTSLEPKTCLCPGHLRGGDPSLPSLTPTFNLRPHLRSSVPILTDLPYILWPDGFLQNAEKEMSCFLKTFCYGLCLTSWPVF